MGGCAVTCHSSKRLPINSPRKVISRSHRSATDLTNRFDDFARSAGAAGDENRYPFVDRAEWMDQAPISKFVKEVLEQRRK